MARSVRARRRSQINVLSAATTRRIPGPYPQHVGRGLDGWAQQHELAVAVDDILDCLRIGVASHQTLTQQHTDVMREIGVGFLDQFVLADQAAQVFTDGLGARFQRGVGQFLLWGNGGGRAAQQNNRQNGQDPLHGAFNCFSSGSSSFRKASAVNGPTNRLRIVPVLSMT